MSLPLSFGVEFEFNVATIRNNLDSIAKGKPNPWPKENRFIHFTPTKAQIARELSIQDMLNRNDEECYMVAARRAAIDHIANTMKAAGLTADPDALNEEDLLMWEFEMDPSIRPPVLDKGEKSEYEFLAVEIKSPAYLFTQDRRALYDIERFCSLMTNTYLINHNESTGLHVHIGTGRGDQGFEFYHLKNLISFLYVFEPQLESIHHPTRINSLWQRSMRDLSKLTYQYQLKHDGQRPTPLEGLAQIQACKKMSEWCLLAADIRGAKHGGCNFGNLHIFAENPNIGDKVTVEFRQHQASMNAARVIEFIEMLVGIVEYTRDVPSKELNALLYISKHEKWTKFPGSNDEEMESRFGCTLADRGFTIVDLLQSINLPNQSLFYIDRRYIHHKRQVEKEDQVHGCQSIEWDYERAGYNVDESDSRLSKEECHDLRQFWEKLYAVAEVQSLFYSRGSQIPSPSPWMDLDHPTWPKHTIRAVKTSPSLTLRPGDNSDRSSIYTDSPSPVRPPRRLMGVNVGSDDYSSSETESNEAGPVGGAKNNIANRTAADFVRLFRHGLGRYDPVATDDDVIQERAQRLQHGRVHDYLPAIGEVESERSKDVEVLDW